MRGASANAVEIVLLTPYEGQLGVLLARDALGRTREPWCLPRAPLTARDTLDHAAARLALRAAGARARWLAQAGAFAAVPRQPGSSALTVAYLGVTPVRAQGPPAGAQWFPSGDFPPVAPRHRVIIDAALAQLRERMDRAPVAFHLLGAAFTLGELQTVYELLLGRRLHKASFRRALQAAFLVEPTGEWRSEGRGRPAQLFRYAPCRRRGARGGVRFDLPGG